MIRMKEFKWVWGLMRKYKGNFFTALGLVFVVNLLNLINPIVQGKIVDEVIEGGMLEKLLPFVLLMIGNTVVRAALRYTYLYMFENVSQNVVYNAGEMFSGKCRNWTSTFSTAPRQAT